MYVHASHAYMPSVAGRVDATVRSQRRRLLCGDGRGRYVSDEKCHMRHVQSVFQHTMTTVSLKLERVYHRLIT